MIIEVTGLCAFMPKKLHIRRSMAIKWIFWFTTHQLTMLHAWGMGRSLTHKWKWQFALNFIRFEDIHHSINDWWIKIWIFYKFTDLESVIFESIKVVFNNTFLNPLLGLGKKSWLLSPTPTFYPTIRKTSVLSNVFLLPLVKKKKQKCWIKWMGSLVLRASYSHFVFHHQREWQEWPLWPVWAALETSACAPCLLLSLLTD